MTMTKKDIVVKIGDDTGVKQVEVRKVLQKALDDIIESLARGETVELRNFGVFKVRTRKGRMGRNPRTGEAVSIPERKIVNFKPGMVMKKRVK